MDDIFSKLRKRYGLPETETPSEQKPSESAPKRRSSYDPLFDKYGKEFGVDPDLLRAMTRQESSFNPRAVSHKNAQGLMQLIPDTAKRFGVKDPFDPDQNIRGGAQYMRWLLDRFKGDVDKALAGYNAGEGAVDKYKGIPPFRETQDYVKKIRSNYRGAGLLGASQPSDNFDTLRSKYGLQGESALGPDFDALRSKFGLGGDRPTTQPSPTNPVTQTVKTPPALPDQTQTIGGTQKLPVMPESPMALEAQMTATADMGSSRKATLLTSADQVKLIPKPALSGLKKLVRPEGIIFYNPAKVKNPESMTTAELIGKVDDVADTSQGIALRTERPDGTELSTSIVTSPESAQQQAQVDQSQFPGQIGRQVVTSAQGALQSRDAEYKKWLADNGFVETPENARSYQEAFDIEQGAKNDQTASTAQYGQPQQGVPAQPQAQIRRLSAQEKIQKAREQVTQPARAKGGTFTIETPKELKGSARQYYLGAMASQLAQQYNVSYDTAYKYLAGDIGGGGGTITQLDETAALDLLKSGRPVSVTLDDAAVNELKALEGMMIQSRKDQELAKSLRNAEFDQFYNEYLEQGELPEVAALRVAQDFGEKEVGGVPIEEAIRRAREAFSQAMQEEGLDRRIASARATAGDTQALDDRVNRIRDLVVNTIQTDGSFTKRAEERRKASAFERDKPMLAAARRGTELFKGLIENVPQAASAVLRTADIIGEINPLSVQNVAGYVSGKEFKASEGQLYQAANEIDGIVERVMPRNKYLDGYRKAGNSIGQMAIQMGLGVATGGVAAPLIYGSSLGASSQYQEADKAGAGKATRQFAAILGGVTAISDALPLQWALKPVTKGGVGRLLSGFFNTVYKEAVPELGEKAAKELVESTFRRLVNRSADVAKKIGAGAKTVGTGAGLEMGQEVLIDKKINDLYASLTYDPNRKVFEINNDDLETAFYAAIGGAAAGGGRILLEQYVAAETEAENAPKPEDVLNDPNADAIDKLIAQTEIKEREAQPTEVQTQGETAKPDAPKPQPATQPTTVSPQPAPMGEATLATDTDAQGEVAKGDVETAPLPATGTIRVFRGSPSDEIAPKDFGAVFVSRSRKAAEQYGDVREYDLDVQNVLSLDDPRVRSLVKEFEQQGGTDLDYDVDEPDNLFLFPDKKWAEFLKSKGFQATSIGDDIALFDTSGLKPAVPTTAAPPRKRAEKFHDKPVMGMQLEAPRDPQTLTGAKNRLKDAATQPQPSPTTAVPSQPAPMGSQALEADTDAQGTVSDVQVEDADRVKWFETIDELLSSDDPNYTNRTKANDLMRRAVSHKDASANDVADILDRALAAYKKDKGPYWSYLFWDIAKGNKATKEVQRKAQEAYDAIYPPLSAEDRAQMDRDRAQELLNNAEKENEELRKQKGKGVKQQIINNERFIEELRQRLATTATPPRKRAEKYHDKPVRGMVLEAPLDPQTLTGAKNRLKEVETELQEERRKGTTDAKMGISNDRTGESFKKGDVIPVTISGEVGLTVAEAEKGLGARKRASKDANPVVRVSKKENDVSLGTRIALLEKQWSGTSDPQKKATIKAQIDGLYKYEALLKANAPRPDMTHHEVVAWADANNVKIGDALKQWRDSQKEGKKSAPLKMDGTARPKTVTITTQTLSGPKNIKVEPREVDGELLYINTRKANGQNLYSVYDKDGVFLGDAPESVGLDVAIKNALTRRKRASKDANPVRRVDAKAESVSLDDTAPQDITRRIVHKIKEKFDPNSTQGIAIRLLEKLIDFDNFTIESFEQHGQSGKKLAGKSDMSTLSGVSIENGMLLSESVLKKALLGNDAAIKTVIHELIHNLTASKLAAIRNEQAVPGYKADDITPEERKAIAELERIFNKAKSELSHLGYIYGLKNLDEFLAESFSNPDFQGLLRTVKGEGKKTSLFTEWFDAIKQLIFSRLRKHAQKHNLPLPSETEVAGILEDVMAWTEDLIKRPDPPAATNPIKREEAKTIQETLRQEFPDLDISISDGDNINLSKVVVPQSDRGTGKGTAFMNRLVQLADEAGKTITLTPSKDFGGSSVARLRKFYQRFGFVDNRGKNKDFSISESMYRPASPAPLPTKAVTKPPQPAASVEETEQKKPWEMTAGEFNQIYDKLKRSNNIESLVDDSYKEGKIYIYTKDWATQTYHPGMISKALRSGDLTVERARELGHFDAYPDLAKEFGGKDAPKQEAKGEKAAGEKPTSPSYRKRLATIQREMKDEFRARRQDGRELPNDLKSAGKRTDKNFEKALDKYVDGMSEPFIRDWHDTIFNKSDDSGILRQVASLDDMFDPATIEAELAKIEPVRNAKGELLAPNGKVSNLPNERIWKMVRTPAFKAWFGDSKVVDENGEPRVVYHGTPNGRFETFERKGERDAGWMGKAFYFTQRRDIALNFTKTGKDGGRRGRDKIYDVFLSAQNPLYIRDLASLKEGDVRTGIDILRRNNNREPISDDNWRKLWDDLQRDIISAEGNEILIAKEWQSYFDLPRLAEVLGYDSIYGQMEGGSWAIFTPTQIKSTSNRGTFSPDDASIFRQAAGENTVEQDRRIFSRDIKRTLNGSINRNDMPQVLSKTPAYLQELGLNAGPIQMPQSVVLKAVEQGPRSHNIAPEVLAKLGDAINDPVAVFESMRNSADRVVVTDLRNKDGLPVVVVLSRNNDSRKLNVNIVPSVHEKNQNRFFSDWLSAGKLLVAQKEKSQEWLRQVGLQLPEAANRSLTEKSVASVGDIVNDSPLFKLADDESKVYVRETLPTAHTQEVLRGVESKFTANNELELTEEAGEIVRRLLTHVNPSDKGRAFFGVTIDRATLRKAGNAAQKFADEYENIGYAESEVKALRDLGDNLIKLSKAESYGVAYIFEDALPEEQHHALVMNAGGISPEAITKLKKNPLWKSARLTREYGKLSDLSRAVEIAAKLETGQNKYWDKVSPKDKKAFLQTVASDIIQRNLDDNGEFGLDEQRYERITKYAKDQADNTEGTQRAGTVSDGSRRTQGDAEPARQRDGDQDQAARTRPADEGDGDRAAEVSREKGQRVAESETKNRQFARSLTKHLMDIADVPYTPQSFEKWADYADSVIADKGLDGAMDEWRSLSGQDNEGRRTALGVTIAKELMDAGRLGDYRTFGEELTNAVGNVAQELAAARMLSRLNPDFAPIHGDKITNKAHGRPQTPEEFAKTQRLAEELKDLADRELLAREGIAQAEERIKNLEEQNAELEQLLTDERKKSKGKSDAELAKALKAAKASLAYYKSLIDEKRKSTPKGVRTPEQIKKFKEKVEANRDEYRRRIQKAFGNAFGTVGDSDTLRMAVPLDDTSNPLGMDAELYEALVDLSADKILTGIEQGLTPEQFVTWLDKLTNNELSEYEKQYIHAAAFSQIRTSKPLTPEAKAKLKTRYAHARVANQILHAEEIAQRKAESKKRKDQRKEYRRSVREMEAAAINEGQAWTLDKFNRVMMNTAEKIDTSEEAVFIAVMIRNFGDMARIKQVYADAGLAPDSFNKAFVEARNLIDFTKEEIERARVEGKTGIKNIAKNELNRFKAEEKITRKEKFLKLKELDTHYKDLTRSKTQRVAFGVLDAWNLVRAVQFSMDAGFALAQGGPTLVTSPSAWFRAMKRGIPAAAEMPALNRWLQKRGWATQDQGLGDLFRRVPVIEKALRKAGFSGDKFMDAVVTEASSPYRARSEAQGVKYEVIGATQDWNESIMSKLSEKIPLVRQSNLAHSLVGDLFRLNQAERYLKWLDRMEADGKLSAFERNRAEEFIMKKWVNVMTGKGYLGPLENVAWAAAQVMSAPRYTASAFQALYYGNPVRYMMLPKGARAIVAHDTAKLYAAGGGLILLLAALGWINLDPEDKDFLVIDANKVPGLKTAAPDMKISLVRWLKESFRLTFGLGIKYAAYQAMGNQDAADRIEREWFNELVASDFGGIGSYWGGRMHPAISTIRTNVTGTNFVGDPVGWEDAEEWLPMPLSIKETVGALKYDRRESILKSGKANPNPSENVKRMLLSVVGNGIGLGMNSYPSTDTTVAQKQAQAMMGRGGDMRSDEEKAASQKANQLERAIREGYDVTEELTAALAKGQITTKQARALQATFANEIGKFQRDFRVSLTPQEKALLMSHRRAFKIIDYLWGQGFQLDRDKIERALKFATKEENTLNDRAAQAEAEAILLRALLRSKKTSKPKK